jgi:hypothetical protein
MSVIGRYYTIRRHDDRNGWLVSVTEGPETAGGILEGKRQKAEGRTHENQPKISKILPYAFPFCLDTSQFFISL